MLIKIQCNVFMGFASLNRNCDGNVKKSCLIFTCCLQSILSLFDGVSNMQSLRKDAASYILASQQKLLLAAINCQSIAISWKCKALTIFFNSSQKLRGTHQYSL